MPKTVVEVNLEKFQGAEEEFALDPLQVSFQERPSIYFPGTEKTEAPVAEIESEEAVGIEKQSSAPEPVLVPQLVYATIPVIQYYPLPAYS